MLDGPYGLIFHGGSDLSPYLKRSPGAVYKTLTQRKLCQCLF